MPIRTTLRLEGFTDLSEVEKLLHRHNLREYRKSSPGSPCVHLEGEFQDLSRCHAELYNNLGRFFSLDASDGDKGKSHGDSRRDERRRKLRGAESAGGGHSGAHSTQPPSSPEPDSSAIRGKLSPEYLLENSSSSSSSSGKQSRSPSGNPSLVNDVRPTPPGKTNQSSISTTNSLRGKPKGPSAEKVNSNPELTMIGRQPDATSALNLTSSSRKADKSSTEHVNSDRNVPKPLRDAYTSQYSKAPSTCEEPPRSGPRRPSVTLQDTSSAGSTSETRPDSISTLDSSLTYSSDINTQRALGHQRKPSKSAPSADSNPEYTKGFPKEIQYNDTSTRSIASNSRQPTDMSSNNMTYNSDDTSTRSMSFNSREPNNTSTRSTTSNSREPKDMSTMTSNSRELNDTSTRNMASNSREPNYTSTRSMASNSRASNDMSTRSMASNSRQPNYTSAISMTSNSREPKDMSTRSMTSSSREPNDMSTRSITSSSREPNNTSTRSMTSTSRQPNDMSARSITSNSREATKTSTEDYKWASAHNVTPNHGKWQDFFGTPTGGSSSIAPGSPASGLGPRPMINPKRESLVEKLLVDVNVYMYVESFSGDIINHLLQQSNMEMKTETCDGHVKVLLREKSEDHPEFFYRAVREISEKYDTYQRTLRTEKITLSNRELLPMVQKYLTDRGILMIPIEDSLYLIGPVNQLSEFMQIWARRHGAQSQGVRRQGSRREPSPRGAGRRPEGGSSYGQKTTHPPWK